MSASLPEDLDWTLEGRLVEASNVVLRLVGVPRGGDAHRGAGVPEDVEVSWDDASPRAVYKPVAGERPLADFPPGTLAHREVATWIVADAAGLDCVPQTIWFDGEFGDGSLQRWVGPLVPQEQEHVALLDEDELEAIEGVHPIAAFEGDDGALVLVHTDEPALRAVALLDVITNNADRKGSHLLDAEADDGATGDESAGDASAGDGRAARVHAIDNGLTFHVEDKLRTVLWGFAGEPLTECERACLARLRSQREVLDEALRAHLSPAEITAFHRRTDGLIASGAFPEPPSERYALPWPPL